MKKLVPALLLLASFVSAQTEKPAKPAAPAPKITYVKAGKLFDSVSDTYRNNMVIVV